MFFQRIHGRALGPLAVSISICLACLLCTGAAFAGSKKGEVAVKHKTGALEGFRLVDYQNELLQCSALSAIHMWIGDNLGDGEGAMVRKTLDEDYWLETSKEYLALANQAAGNADLSDQVGREIKNLAAEWRHLNEDEVAPEEWNEWYALVERCDTWRPDPPRKPYFNNGGQSTVGNARLTELVPGSH